MRIEKLELVKCKRLSLNNIDHFTYTPNNRLQLILGSNGSGKSSIINELSPLPAQSSDYHAGGYKYIEITHNNNVYKLKSSFIDGNRYSFIKNDEELNQGGGIRQYTTLVYREFGIDSNLHEIMTGSKSFHRLSVAERRSWFTRLSDVDYTYALEYFKKLSSYIRDLEGSVKTMQSRLIQESDQILTKDQEEELRKDIDKLNELLSSIVDKKVSIPETKEDLLNTLIATDEDIAAKKKELDRLLSIFTDLTMYSDLASVQEMRVSLLGEEKVYEDRLVGLKDQLEKAHKDIEILDKIGDVDLSRLKQDIDDSKTRLEARRALLTHGVRITDLPTAINSLEGVLTAYKSNITDLLSYNIGPVSRSVYEESYKAMEDIDRSIKSIEAILRGLDTQDKHFNHLKENNNTTCPVCKHSWLRDYDQVKHDKILKDIEDHQSKLVTLYESKDKLSERHEAITNCIEILKKCEEIHNHIPVLNPFWDDIRGFIKEEPSRVPIYLDRVLGELKMALEIDTEDKKLQEDMKLYNEANASNVKNIEDKKNYIGGLEDSYTSIVEKLSRVRGSIARCERVISLHRTIDKYRNELDSLVYNREQISTRLLDAVTQSYYNELIYHLKIDISNKEQIRNKLDMRKGIVKDIEEQISKHTENISLCKIALRELSPSEGLIAKGLTNFINGFVITMNEFINHIWSYPLVLVPIIPDGDVLDLDYRFALKVNEDIEVSDISKVSAGMKEVINLAFKVTIMKYLGIEEFPLYLDELGANMDHTHRIAASKAISKLVDESNFSQIFVVSHHEQGYGSLANADITVLCPSNIVMPKNSVYNNVCTLL